jgi:hypothetical protein
MALEINLVENTEPVVRPEAKLPFRPGRCRPAQRLAVPGLDIGFMGCDRRLMSKTAAPGRRLSRRDRGVRREKDREADSGERLEGKTSCASGGGRASRGLAFGEGRSLPGRFDCAMSGRAEPLASLAPGIHSSAASASPAFSNIFE